MALGREGFAGFQQGLEAGDDIRPAHADHLDDGAARLEAVVNHGQLHALRDGLDVEGDLGARFAGQLGRELLIPAKPILPL